MNLHNAISELVELSHYAGVHPLFVQGGGGNCSVKASGIFVEEITTSKGYACLDLDSGKQIDNLESRPSLETPLHLLLGAYIIHTHPMVVGALVCSKEGKSQYRDVLSEKNCYWVDYANPGKQLSIKVQEVLAANNCNVNDNLVLLLENHGIFVSSNSKQNCIDLHKKCTQELDRFFNVNDAAVAETYTLSDAQFLTPDHVVYSEMNKDKLSFKQQLALNELNEYSKRVVGLIVNKKWQLQFLNPNDVDFLKHMDEEKYRQKMLGGEK
jgi:rhamnose utilization protein RhaD (predicted bifunctional aldolase and dehydrogenase)